MVWGGRAEGWEWVGGRNDRSQDSKVFACRCRCEKMATVTQKPPPPGSLLACFWPLCKRACACKHLFERQPCLQMRFRCHPRVAGARVQPGERGIKEGPMHFDGSPPLPLGRLVSVSARWSGWVKTEIKNQIDQDERERKENGRVEKNKATLF